MLLIGNVFAATCFLPSKQYFALETFFNSTNGYDWSWKNETLYGNRWDFSTSNSSLPCTNNWQGIYCQCKYGVYSIINLNLVDYNLNGTIPSSIEYLTGLLSFNVGKNGIFGPIPSSVATMRNLLEFSVYENFLSGSLPSQLGQLSRLLDLSVYSNMLQGTIPTALGNLLSLQDLYLFSNRFVGTLPSQLGNLLNLTSLWLYSNDLHGEIPSSIGSLTKLTKLYLNHNQFTGTVPDSLSQLQNLISIDFAANLLSGSFPPFFFSYPHIQSISMASNCFSGFLAPSICDYPMKELSILVMDGLSSAPNCPDNLYANNHRPFFVKGYIQFHTLSGSIPICLWGLPNITSMHFSGNGFDGAIGDLPSDSILQQLSLSNNRLNGTIPNSVQTHSFADILDLSSNRFMGTLSKNFYVSNTQNTLEMSVNRLSGPLPDAFLNVNANLTELEVLAGNRYQCSDSHLPPQDPYVHLYNCASNDLNTSVYSWLGFLGFLSFAVCFFMYLAIRKPQDGIISKFTRFLNSGSQWVIYIFDWWEAVSILNVSTSKLRIHQLILFLECLRICGLWASMILATTLLICLPINVTFNSLPSNDYKSVTLQYGWVIGSVYLRGTIPACYLGIIIISFLYFITNFAYRHRERVIRFLSLRNEDKYSHNQNHNEHKFICLKRFWSWKKVIQPTIFQLINFVVTATVNILYVRSLMMNGALTTGTYLFLQFLVAIFKLVWNISFVPLAVNRLHLSPVNIMRHRYVMLVVNFIFSPCIATLMSNQACFYYVFFAYPSLTASFSDSICNYELNVQTMTLQCTSTTTENFHASFIPPFLYSYHCGASLLVTYIPVLLYAYAMSGMIMPIVRILILLYPSLRSYVYPLAIFRDEYNNILVQNDDDRVLVDGKAVVCTILLHLTVLLTFGISYPMLGFAVVFTIMMDIITRKLTLGKYIFLTEQMYRKTAGYVGFSNYSKDIPQVHLSRAFRYTDLQKAHLFTDGGKQEYSSFSYSVTGDIENINASKSVAQLEPIFECDSERGSENRASSSNEPDKVLRTNRNSLLINDDVNIQPSDRQSSLPRFSLFNREPRTSVSNAVTNSRASLSMGRQSFAQSFSFVKGGYLTDDMIGDQNFIKVEESFSAAAIDVIKTQPDDIGISQSDSESPLHMDDAGSVEFSNNGSKQISTENFKENNEVESKRQMEECNEVSVVTENNDSVAPKNKENEEKGENGDEIKDASEESCSSEKLPASLAENKEDNRMEEKNPMHTSHTSPAVASAENEYDVPSGGPVSISISKMKVPISEYRSHNNMPKVKELYDYSNSSQSFSRESRSTSTSFSGNTSMWSGNSQESFRDERGSNRPFYSSSSSNGDFRFSENYAAVDDAVLLLSKSVENAWSAIHSCAPYLIAIVTFFWGLNFFDMIADIYGLPYGVAGCLSLAIVCPLLIYIVQSIVSNSYVRSFFEKHFVKTPTLQTSSRLKHPDSVRISSDSHRSTKHISMARIPFEKSILKDAIASSQNSVASSMNNYDFNSGDFNPTISDDRVSRDSHDVNSHL